MTDYEEIHRELDALRAEVTRLRHIVEAKDPTPAPAPNAMEPSSPTAPNEPLETTTGLNRRGLLLLAAGGAAGLATAGSLAATATPAAATSGFMQYGVMNNTDALTSISSTAPNGGFLVNDNAANSGSNYATTTFGVNMGGLLAQSIGREAMTATSTDGPALRTRSINGPALRLFADRTDVPTVAADGSFIAGDLLTDTSGRLWYCTASGSPGSWRLVSGYASAGTFCPVVPFRAYDSRKPQPIPGPLAAGNNRVIDVSKSRNPVTGAVIANDAIPVGSMAVAINLTITDTAGSGGWLGVTTAVQLNVTTSTINWTAPGQTNANGAIVSCPDRLIRVVCGPAGGGRSTDFIVDVTGYWR